MFATVMTPYKGESHYLLVNTVQSIMKEIMDKIESKVPVHSSWGSIQWVGQHERLKPKCLIECELSILWNLKLCVENG